jgi:hypothetical protein
MTSGSDDPTDIRSIAVTADDLVSALEATERGGRDAVLRVTPPFSGRMRARLHVEGTAQYDDPPPIHIQPTTLLADSTPDYPTPAETETRLREDPDVQYSRERHHDRHAEAVAEWRDAVRTHVVEATTIDTPGGPHEVTISLLG